MKQLLIFLNYYFNLEKDKLVIYEQKTFITYLSSHMISFVLKNFDLSTDSCHTLIKYRYYAT